MNLFKDVLYYKKSLLLAVFSLFFLQSSFSIYGSFALGIGIFVILILYFFTSVYKNPPFPKNITPISEDFSVAKKEPCNEPNMKGGSGSKKGSKYKKK